MSVGSPVVPHFHFSSWFSTHLCANKPPTCGPGSEPQGCWAAQVPAGQRDDWGQHPPQGVCVVSLCGAPHPAEGEPRQPHQYLTGLWAAPGGRGGARLCHPCSPPAEAPRTGAGHVGGSQCTHSVTATSRARGVTRMLQGTACVHLGPPFFKVKLVTD